MHSDAPFTSIVCGIDGGGAALEGARQAAALAGADASVELVAIVADPFDLETRARSTNAALRNGWP